MRETVKWKNFVDIKNVQKFVSKHKIKYYECSAKTGANVNDIFSIVAQDLLVI